MLRLLVLSAAARLLTDKLYRNATRAHHTSIYSILSPLSTRTMSTPAPPPQDSERAKCLFCRFCDGVESCNIIHKDEEFVVFPDIRPAAPHHYLVLTRHHYVDAKHLTKDEIPIVERMAALGKEVLTTQGGSPDTARLGFHWPPFHSQKHLHLHVIAPESEMGFLPRAMFKTNSFWFVSPEKVIEQLQAKV